MRTFKATAFNKDNLTFSFTFVAEGWGADLQEYARAKLDKLVDADEMHKRYGPWDFRGVDVAS